MRCWRCCVYPTSTRSIVYIRVGVYNTSCACKHRKGVQRRETNALRRTRSSRREKYGFIYYAAECRIPTTDHSAGTVTNLFEGHGARQELIGGPI